MVSRYTAVGIGTPLDIGAPGCRQIEVFSHGRPVQVQIAKNRTGEIKVASDARARQLDSTFKPGAVHQQVLLDEHPAGVEFPAENGVGDVKLSTDPRIPEAHVRKRGTPVHQ